MARKLDAQEPLLTAVARKLGQAAGTLVNVTQRLTTDPTPAESQPASTANAIQPQRSKKKSPAIRQNQTAKKRRAIPKKRTAKSRKPSARNRIASKRGSARKR